MIAPAILIRSESCSRRSEARRVASSTHHNVFDLGRERTARALASAD
jgi:hypothetical protein